MNKRINKKGFTITTNIIILTSIISIIMFFFLKNENIIEYFVLIPLNIIQGKYLWTLITHIFIHGNISHLFINMFGLFSVGILCEKIIGRKRFLWFYLGAGLFAAILSVVTAVAFSNSAIGQKIFGPANVPMVGASGAIFGIAGLLMILLPKLKFMIIFLPFFSLPAFIIIPLVLALMWIASYLFNFPIGNVAHLGGLLFGILYGAYLKKKYKKKIMKLRRLFK